MTSTEATPEVGPLDLIASLMRQARTVVVLGLTGAAIGLGLSLLAGVDYVSDAQFVPETAGQGNRFSGIAAQLGFAIPGGGSDESPAFYQELLESRALLGEAVTTPLRLGDRQATLVELWGGDGNERQRVSRAVAQLSERVGVSTNLEANVITVRVRADRPELAAQVNRRLLDLVNEHNLTKRQHRARAEREFVEERLQEVGAQLAAAETALERFLTQNRTYESSAALRFEASRLQRQIDLNQQVYTSLSQASVQASLDEVRNTPVVTVIDPPEASVRRVGGTIVYYARNILFGLVLGTLIGMLVALWRDYVARLAIARPDALARLREARASARAALRNPLSRR